MRALPPTLAGLLLVLAVPVVGAGNDARPRGYAALRLGVQVALQGSSDGLALSRPNDAYGVTLGVEASPGLGVEAAVDYFEPSVRLNGVGSIGELGVLTLVPQLRLRSALGDERLAGYAVAGLGVSLSQFNDRKPPGFGHRIHGRDLSWALAAGLGAEFALAPNLALGIESRLLLSGPHDLTVDGQRRQARLDSVLTSAHLRVRFPEDPDRPPRADRRAVFAGFRAGGAVPLRRDLGGGLVLRPESAALAGELNHAVGATVGVELTRTLGLELAVDGSEPALALRERGTVGEYAVVTLVPQLRWRAALTPGLELAGLAGLGLSFAEFNDTRPPGEPLSIKGRDLGLAAAVGLALEYRVASNVAVGVESKYQTSQGHRLVVAGHSQDVDLDMLLTTLGLRVLFFPGGF